VALGPLKPMVSGAPVCRFVRRHPVGLKLGFFAPASGPGCFLEVSVRVGNSIQSGVVS
jgi:hypothetical protein